MPRFIWINTEELFEKYVGGHARYAEYKNGLVFDTELKKIIMDFGSQLNFFTASGTPPNDKYLKIIMDALNKEVVKDD